MLWQSACVILIRVNFMIDQINGTIIGKYDSYASIMVAGIGFKINMSINDNLGDQYHKCHLTTKYLK